MSIPSSFCKELFHLQSYKQSGMEISNYNRVFGLGKNPCSVDLASEKTAYLIWMCKSQPPSFAGLQLTHSGRDFM